MEQYWNTSENLEGPGIQQPTRNSIFNTNIQVGKHVLLCYFLKPAGLLNTIWPAATPAAPQEGMLARQLVLKRGDHSKGQFWLRLNGWMLQ